ncbi:hypothetical protein [Halobellus rufus]|uniref:hypothetical protein n=1 Tax=Halobellus rufus TaxID=1448860 RepID=UPI000678E3EC|nr:hypothetical protein [Halobellus rufus]
MSTDTSHSSTVLVVSDDALASSIRAVASGASEPFAVYSATTGTQLRHLLDRKQIDCVVSRTPVPDATCPVILYPKTPDSDLARASTGDRSVRYLPQSIDTADHALLVDAIDTCLDGRESPNERADHEVERDLLAEMSNSQTWGDGSSTSPT